MALLSFFRKPADSSSNAGPDKSGARSAPPVAAAPVTKPADPLTAQNQIQSKLGHALEMFNEIQNVIGKPDNIIELPAKVLLHHLPAHLRGPAWKENDYPNTPLELEKESLLDQLRRGRVGYQLQDLAQSLPSGWIKADPDTVVEMNLAELVCALPPELLRTQGRLDSDTVQATQMRDFFSPAAPAAPSEPVAPPAPEPIPVADAAPVPASGVETSSVVPPAPVAEPAAPTMPQPKPRRIPVPRPPIPNAWDGLDRTPDAGACTLDLNRAGAEEIASLPAMGMSSAQRILDYRAQHGPFKGIYELLAIPGIGPRVFHRMTGLDHRLRRRFDRHNTLNEELGLSLDARPSLAQVTNLTAAALAAGGCVLASQDGIVIAESDGLGKETERLAALSPKFFRRTRRYLRQISEKPVFALTLPAATPPLMLVMSTTSHMILLQKPEGLTAEATRKAMRIAGELEWLMSRRAVVRPL